MDEPHEPSARVSLRAHILASINPFRQATATPISANGGGSRKKRTSSSQDKDSKRRKVHDPDGAPAEMAATGGGRNAGDGERDGEHDGHHGTDEQSQDDKLRPRGSKIQFKARRRETSSRRDGEASGRDSVDRDAPDMPESESHIDEDHNGEPHRDEHPPRRHHRRHRHHHRRHGRRRSQSPSAGTDRDDRDEHSHRHENEKHTSRTRSTERRQRRRRDTTEEDEDPYADPPLDPDAAFRQSLFDAMADDEGAAYWEAIYGQPVRAFAEEAKQASNTNSTAKDDPDGLAAMDDEQYADYVRRRMWERSDAGRREAREAQKRQQAAAAAADEKRRQQKQEQEHVAAGDRAHWAAVDRSLRRGEARRARRWWQDQWQAYTDAWAGWEAQPSPQTIPWPVPPPRARDGGGGGDVDQAAAKAAEEAYAKEVRAFFTGDAGDTDTTETGLLARLRDERVRWHPDKMQQRLGGSVDATVLRDVTAIFQVVDRLWGEMRKRK